MLPAHEGPVGPVVNGGMEFGIAAILVSILGGCAPPAPRLAPAVAELASAESLYADLRSTRDRFDVGVAAGRPGNTDATSFSMLVQGHNTVRQQLASRLSAIDSAALTGDDARALGIMRRTLARDLDSIVIPAVTGPVPSASPDCGYDAGAIARPPHGLDSLRNRLYACYGWAQSHLVLDRDTLDRLSIFGALGRTEEAERRRQLFLALQPVWRSVNGDNQPGSPYRLLIAGEVRARRSAEPAAEQARASGVPPDSLERWLVAILTAWRAATPDSAIEPWDWYYLTGRASRA